MDNHSSEYSPPLLSEHDQHQNHDKDKEEDGFGDQNNDPCLERQRPQSVKDGFGLGRRLVHLDLHLTTALQYSAIVHGATVGHIESSVSAPCEPFRRSHTRSIRLLPASILSLACLAGNPCSVRRLPFRTADAKILSVRRCATAKLSEEVKRIIAATQPAFVATASKNGKPNVSPKGSFKVIDDDHVAFAEIASPNTIANIRENPQVEVMVFSPDTWGGCRIKGKAEILESGDLLESFKAQFAPMKMKVRSVVKIAVEEVVIMPPMKAGSKK